MSSDMEQISGDTLSDTGSVTLEEHDRFRLNPHEISATLNHGRSEAQIEEMIHDVDQREALAKELLDSVPSLREQYADIQQLEARLEKVSRALPQKQSFFKSIQEKLKWVKDSVAKVLNKPAVKLIVLALLAWWAWGHIHGLLAEAHGASAALGAELQGGLTEGAAAAAPGMGDALMETPGGGGMATGSSADFEFEIPSAGSEIPDMPPPKPAA